VTEQALHGALWRQLRKLGLTPHAPPEDATSWSQLLGAVSGVYAKAEHTAAVQSRRDALSGLPNRVALLELLRRALATAGPGPDAVAVLFVDLDGFKLVNDTLGHSTGDVLLVRVARLLESSVRDGDSVARMGGDEFVVLCPACDTETADAIATRIGTVLDTPITVGTHELFVTASIGVATADGRRDSADVLRDADLAMYAAKARGRSQFVRFDDGMRRALAGRVSTETALHHAIENDELTVYYQPIIRLHDEAVIGMEALLRWQRPGHGLVLPGAFIEVAEHSRLIKLLDTWVLGRACSDAAGWADSSITVAVNLTARDLEHDDLSALLSSILYRTRLNPARLVTELTERTLMSESPAIAGNLRRLRALGARIAIDDFGTGYSSLSYLGRLPVSLVKIDQSFIQSIDTDESAAAIVGAIVTMSHALDLGVIAEGVERPAQAQRLRDLGCDSAQGYLFARPMPRADAAALIAARNVPQPRVGTGRDPSVTH